MSLSIKQRIVEKRKQLNQKATLDYYQNQPSCEVLQLVKSQELTPFYDFLRNSIRYEQATPYTDRFLLTENETHSHKKDWILTKIQAITSPPDIILLPLLDFGIRLRLTDVTSFFIAEIAQSQTQHLGFDIGYINETKHYYHYFSDEEHYLFEYAQTW